MKILELVGGGRIQVFSANPPIRALINVQKVKQARLGISTSALLKDATGAPFLTVGAQKAAAGSEG